VDQTQRKRSYAQIQRLIREDAPSIYLFTQYDSLGVSKKVDYQARGDEWLWLFDAKPKS
jgi:peptide/nickel transport system substrate-binding protein